MLDGRDVRRSERTTRTAVRYDPAAVAAAAPTNNSSALQLFDASAPQPGMIVKWYEHHLVFNTGADAVGMHIYNPDEEPPFGASTIQMVGKLYRAATAEDGWAPGPHWVVRNNEGEPLLQNMNGEPTDEFMPLGWLHRASKYEYESTPKHGMFVEVCPAPW